MKCQSLFFLGKNKKKYSKVTNAEILTQHAKLDNRIVLDATKALPLNQQILKYVLY